MGRPHRAASGGYVYHVLNRANAGITIFERDSDYRSFEIVLAQAVERTNTRLLAYCVMPNHWHLIVWPRTDHELSQFVGWLTLTHTQRWHAHRGSAGSGHLYQGRFKSFPVQEDEHFYTVVRYVERNALRANLTDRAEHWRWGSLHRWLRGWAQDEALLADWPALRTAMWVEHVNAPQTDAELQALRRCIERSSPFGHGPWSEKAARELGLESRAAPARSPKEKVSGTDFYNQGVCAENR